MVNRKSAKSILLALLAPLLLAQCNSVSETQPLDRKTGNADERYRVVSFYFLSSKRGVQPSVAKAPPVRWIRTGEKFATRVVRTLLSGPNDAERSAGYYVNYHPTALWPTTPAPTKSLKSYFNFIKISNRVATIDFDPGAKVYLDAPADLEFSVKGPIQKTLIKLPEIDKVEFSINHKPHRTQQSPQSPSI